MQICYGILSSSTTGGAVNQLAKSLGTKSTIVIHHDYSQQPEFSVDDGPNITVLKDYVKTEWGRWSQAQAIICLLEHSLNNSSFDYFQLLSETCLPIRPIHEFEEFLATTKPDACIGLIRLSGKPDDIGTLNYAWRYFSTYRRWNRVIAILSQNCLDEAGKSDPKARDLFQGLSVIKLKTIKKRYSSLLNIYLLKTVLKLGQFLHPFDKIFDCYVGSTWFCINRKTAEYLLNEIKNKPALIAHYRGTRSPDESIFHSVLGNAAFEKLSSINHFISWQQRESGPDELATTHFDAMKNSKKFFARKFSKSPTDDFRLQTIAGQITQSNQLLNSPALNRGNV